MQNKTKHASEILNHAINQNKNINKNIVKINHNTNATYFRFQNTSAEFRFPLLKISKTGINNAAVQRLNSQASKHNSQDINLSEDAISNLAHYCMQEQQASHLHTSTF